MEVGLTSDIFSFQKKKKEVIKVPVLSVLRYEMLGLDQIPDLHRVVNPNIYFKITL